MTEGHLHVIYHKATDEIEFDFEGVPYVGAIMAYHDFAELAEALRRKHEANAQEARA